MPDYKYRFHFNGDYYVGNSIDDIAGKISKDPNNSISFTQAVSLVNKGLIPVMRNQVQRFGPKNASSMDVIADKNNCQALTPEQMARGAKEVLSQTLGISVGQAEITRRANICHECPMKSTSVFCGACGQGAKITRLVNKVKGWFGKGTKIPLGLDQCYCSTGCCCSLAMMLPAPLDHISETTKNDPKRPDFCWMKA